MQTNKTTYYQLILDQSGSMESCKKATIDGFNNQLKSIHSMKIEYPEQEFFVSLTKFSSEPQHLFLDCSVDKIKNLTAETYNPDGNTALLDAIGECLFRLKTEKREEFAEDKATAVVVIITDGFENASKYFTQTAISRLIKDLSATDNFSISFLGASIESIQQAERINIPHENTRVYDSETMEEPFNLISDSLRMYASGKNRGSKPKKFFNEK